MKLRSKLILTVSLSCMGAGLLLAGAGALCGGVPGILISSEGFQPASRSKEPYILEKTQIDPFSAAEMDLSCSADIQILSSDDGNCYLEYLLDGSGQEPSWEVSGGRLVLTQQSRSRGGVFLFGTDIFSRDANPRVRLYLPEESVLSDLEITSSYGDFSCSALSAETADIHMDYGDLTLSGSTFGTLSLDLGSGDTDIRETTADTLVLSSEYGNCTLRKMTVKDADIELEYGNFDLEASGLQTLNGTSEYGDISLILSDGAAGYSYRLSTEYGDISLPGSVPGRILRDEDGEPFFEREESSGKSITFATEYGNISIGDQ